MARPNRVAPQSPTQRSHPPPLHLISLSHQPQHRKEKQRNLNIRKAATSCLQPRQIAVRQSMCVDRGSIKTYKPGKFSVGSSFFLGVFIGELLILRKGIAPIMRHRRKKQIRPSTVAGLLLAIILPTSLLTGLAATAEPVTNESRAASASAQTALNGTGGGVDRPLG